MRSVEQTRFGEVYGCSLAGRGPTVMLMPGVMADAESWLPVARALPDSRAVMIVNRRGRAPSAPLGADYSVATEVADLLGVLASLDAPAHLFGWSYGALAAVEAAASGIDLRSLTLYEPVSRPFAPEAIAPIRQALTEGRADRAVELINTDVSGFSADHVAALRQSPVWDTLCRLALPLGEELAAIDAFEPAYPRYRSLAAPVTLIAGQSTIGHAPYGDAFKRFADALPDAAHRVLPGLGHLAHVDDPVALASAIEHALRQAETRV